MLSVVVSGARALRRGAPVEAPRFLEAIDVAARRAGDLAETMIRAGRPRRAVTARDHPLLDCATCLPDIVAMLTRLIAATAMPTRAMNAPSES